MHDLWRLPSEVVELIMRRSLSCLVACQTDKQHASQPQNYDHCHQSHVLCSCCSCSLRTRASMKRRQRLQAQQRMRRLRCRRNVVIPTFTTSDRLHTDCQAQQEFSTMCITSGHCPNVRRRLNGPGLVQRESLITSRSLWQIWTACVQCFVLPLPALNEQKTRL